MLKIIKKLIKCNSDYHKKYVLIYRQGLYDDYDFGYYDEEGLKKVLKQVKMFDFHIFLTKDELKIETNVDLEVEE